MPGAARWPMTDLARLFRLLNFEQRVAAVGALLLAISTLAFAVAAELYIFPRPLFDVDQTNVVEFNRGKLGPVDLTLHNRAYYWFVLAVLVIVLLVVGHLRRTGIGRSIIGVRENEAMASALTVSPTRTKLTAFAMGGFIAGLGGALLGICTAIACPHRQQRFTAPSSSSPHFEQ